MATLERFSSSTHVALALISVSAFAIPLTQAQSPTGYSGPGRYQIANVASGKVVDVVVRDGRTARQWCPAYGGDQLNAPHDPRNQQWEHEDAGFGFVDIRAAQHGMNLV